MPADWSDAELIVATNMLEDGATGADIATALHRSRNSVAGKVFRNSKLKQMRERMRVSMPTRGHRKGKTVPTRKGPTTPVVSEPPRPEKLADRAAQQAALDPVARADQQTLSRAAVANQSKASRSQSALEQRSKLREHVRLSPPTMFKVPLCDLKQGDCKWPVQDSPSVVGFTLFCAAATGDITRPYCKYHKAISSGLQHPEPGHSLAKAHPVVEEAVDVGD